MKTRQIQQLKKCDRRMFGDLVVTCQTPVPGVVASTPGVLTRQSIIPIPYTLKIRRVSVDSVSTAKPSILEVEKRRATALVDELLTDIYYGGSVDYSSASGKSHRNSWIEIVDLQQKDVCELHRVQECLYMHVERMGGVLVRRLKRRDALRRQQEAYCDVISEKLTRCVSQGTSSNMRFTIQPLPGDTGFSQWVSAMKMVAQLPGGIPPEFRRRLWLTMAEKHLAAKGVDWPEVERTCFSEWSHPADAELGVQIVKDLHRTGCSLFCGEDGQENQALLKRVLLAYARWNKAVGYCQGFNMLAALILQVTEKCESDALKLMIYLIEGVLPDSYFADSLRGLSVDMAVFRELLRSRLPRLSRHLDQLQNASTKDGTRSYEPPLTNVFTMQWFLTLFCNCLPHPTVLRVWDLILLEGNEILLRTALAIWQVLEERILSVRTADEFYCLMGALTRELLEFDLINANSLVRAIVVIGPLNELNSLREHYLYNINPWGKNLPQIVDKQLKLYPKQNITLDISALKKQYAKLKQRQRQAHIIFSAAITRQPPPSTPVAMNHLLLGKSALVPAKRIGPVQGSIPPARQVTPSTLHWKDTPKQPSSSSSSDTELCDEESEDSTSEDEESKSKSKEKDNLAEENKQVFMTTTDNTLSANSSTKVEIDETSTQLPPDILTNPKYEKYESEDESSDFEQFLADRVKSLGQSIEENSQERVTTARRNSERALQIIQENSLILHRIMQCQARFSPSPPSSDTKDEDNMACASYSSSLPFTDKNEYDDDDKNNEVEKIDEPVAVLTTEIESPIYGSKYTSILEKSKSLDERYNALILNILPKEKKENMSKTISASNIVMASQTFTHNDNPDVSHWSPITISIDSPRKFNFDISDNQTKADNFVADSKKDTYNAINLKYLNNITEVIDTNEDVTESQSFDIKRYSLNSPENLTKAEDGSTKYLDYLQEKISSPMSCDYKSSIGNKYSKGSTEYSQNDTSQKVEVCSPLSEEKYNLPIIDFEKFYSITTEVNIPTNLEFVSPMKIGYESSFSISDVDLKDSNSPTTFSIKKDITYDDDSKVRDRDYPGLRDSSITDIFPSSSSKTCYNYLINKNVETKSYDAVLTSSTGENKSMEFTTCLEDKRKSLNLDIGPSSPYLKSPVISPLKSMKSPSKSPLKSPSQTFNPFPVPISPRQSKEVPLKLGLYKK